MRSIADEELPLLLDFEFQLLDPRLLVAAFGDFGQEMVRRDRATARAG